MKLIFQNSQGKERVIANVNSLAEADNEMNKFMEERNFKSPYKRLWEHDGRVIVDVGSHYEYFIMDPCTFAWCCSQYEDIAEDEQGE